MQAQRQVAANQSPRSGYREVKLSNASDLSAAALKPARMSQQLQQPDLGDKENRDNIIRDTFLDNKDNREHELQKLQFKAKLQEVSAELTEKNEKLEKKEFVIGQMAATRDEAHAQIDRLRMVVEEKEATQEELEKQLQHMKEEKMVLQEENGKLKQAREERIGKLQKEGEQDSRTWQERCANAEALNIELNGRNRVLERQSANAQRAAALADEEKQAQLWEKDQHLHDLQCDIQTKAVQLQEMERVMREKDQRMSMEIHDKDQTLQQLKHENQQQDTLGQAQLNDLQAKLEALHYQVAEEKALLGEREAQLAEREAHRKSEEKELRGFRQKFIDQKIIIEKLDLQLRRTSEVASLITPGEFLRMSKSKEAQHGLADEAGRLFAEKKHLETETVCLRKELDLVKSKIPPDMWEQWRREAASSAAAEQEPVTA